MPSRKRALPLFLACFAFLPRSNERQERPGARLADVLASGFGAGEGHGGHGDEGQKDDWRRRKRVAGLGGR